MKKPNILFLFADDQRFDTIAALGHKDIITPNLDKLMASGMAFTQAHIQGGCSGAICMPSRAMLNTGRPLFSLFDKGQEIPDDHTLLGEFLQEQGYETFGSGKWHNGAKAYARSFTDGDSIFFGGMHDHWMVPFYHYDETGKYDQKIKRTWNYTKTNSLNETPGNYVRPGEHSTDIIADSLINFLDKKHDKPFYAYGAFLAPHDPRTMPQEFLDMYDDVEIDLPENFQSYHHIEYGNWNCRDEVLAPYPRTFENTKQQIKEYYAMITHLDYQVGRVLDKLEEIGEKDNTIIIYAADNGLAMGQHGLFGKQSLYDHSMRVPLIVAGKDIPQGTKNDSRVYLYDIFPTICDVLGADAPKSVMGTSFVSALADNTNCSRDSLYFVYVGKIRGITKGSFKYIEHRHEGVITRQLFNLDKDPYEMANLYYDSDHQEIVHDMQSTMRMHAENSGEFSNEFGKEYWNV